MSRDKREQPMIGKERRQHAIRPDRRFRPRPAGADLAAVPSNARPELLAAIERSGSDHAFRSTKPMTEAVIEALGKVANEELTMHS
jgi:hypothetical protein